MAFIKIRVCDSCKTELKETKEIYKLNLQTGNFLDAAGSRDHNLLSLDFCESCARDIRNSLQKIGEEKDMSEKGN